MQPLQYKCPKCNHTQCEIGEIRVTGGFWSKIFDVQGKRFSSVTCSKCKYTEFFKAESSMLGNIFDLFVGD